MEDMEGIVESVMDGFSMAMIVVGTVSRVSNPMNLRSEQALVIGEAIYKSKPQNKMLEKTCTEERRIVTKTLSGSKR